MRSKGRQGRYSLILLFLGIFAFWWGIAVLGQGGKSDAVQAVAMQQQAAVYVPQQVSGPLSIATSSNGNTFSYSGSISLSPECERLATGVSVTGASPKHVTVMLTLERKANCTSTTTSIVKQPFAVSVEVPSGTSPILDGVTTNGAIVAITSAEAK